MTKPRKKTARMTSYAPPPYPGTSKHIPIDVDSEDQTTTNLKCTVITRGNKIRALQRELKELKAQFTQTQDLHNKREEDATREREQLKETNKTLAKELKAARAKLSTTRHQLKRILEEM
ncbi:uncharacterized protein SCHCODRAFT_02663887 [Schizophyllum commune H4-8]|nr:uncharacterized protein SCHCODRAFT_02663887 [Schizophyllum commune H4-8]KAI5896023.1 hypothetical protein SCHCODRAFT_02663887 [Schizophyllum commune H4-8]